MISDGVHVREVKSGLPEADDRRAVLIVRLSGEARAGLEEMADQDHMSIAHEVRDMILEGIRRRSEGSKGTGGHADDDVRYGDWSS